MSSLLALGMRQVFSYSQVLLPSALILNGYRFVVDVVSFLNSCGVASILLSLFLLLFHVLDIAVHVALDYLALQFLLFKFAILFL